ncbi:SagB family peptide dehydrogenase [Candidatus Acidianus copahuensis]|uniref:SagB family peptide dehydrogenase n=1 Tax=Candidatus Acidianus copahuensis TaxID=1160895 RepID=UPI00135F1955|nr:SagB family peptide dehydrogenase [Candidatus Acidianus copahuensis]
MDLLYHSSGVRKRGEIPFRTFPSAGGLSETEVYVTPYMSDLEINIYHHNCLSHSIEKLNLNAFSALQSHALSSIPGLNAVPLLIILTSRYGRTIAKCSNRGVRLLPADLGIVMENFFLIVTTLGLGICAVGYFNDYFVNKILDIGIEKGEVKVDMLVVGEKDERRS